MGLFGIKDREKFAMKKFIMLLILAGSVSAQEVEDIVTDRPDQTESAVTVPRGFFQFELGASIEHVTSFNSPIGKYRLYSHSYPSLLIRYGVTKSIELRLASEYQQEELSNPADPEPNITGFSPLTIGSKIQLFTEKGTRPDAAFIFHLNIPFDTDGPFQSRYIGTDFRFAVAHSLSERFSLSYNLGGEWSGDSPQATGIYTLTLGMSLSNKISAFAESYGFLTQGEAPDHRLDGGFTYLITKNVQADISGGIGITDSSPDFFIGGGISFRLPK